MFKFEIFPDIDVEVTFYPEEGVARFNIWNKRTKHMRQLKPYSYTQAHMILQRLKDTRTKLADYRLKKSLGSQYPLN